MKTQDALVHLAIDVDSLAHVTGGSGGGILSAESGSSMGYRRYAPHPQYDRSGSGILSTESGNAGNYPGRYYPQPFRPELHTGEGM